MWNHLKYIFMTPILWKVKYLTFAGFNILNVYFIKIQFSEIKQRVASEQLTEKFILCPPLEANHSTEAEGSQNMPKQLPTQRKKSG